MPTMYELGVTLRKERDEIAELFKDPSSLTAEKVEEARKRESALAEMQKQFDVLFEADRLERENKAALDRIGTVRRPVPAEGTAPVEQKGKPRPFAEIVNREVATKAAQTVVASGSKVEVPFAELSNDEAARLMPQLKTLFQLSSAPQEDDRLTRIAFDEQEDRSVVNLPAPGTMSGETLSYLEETTFTNNAAEATEGNALGEAALAFTERTASARWLGTFIPVTEQSMADISWLESYLRSRLGFMVAQRLALQVLVGDGVAPNINGYATAVTQSQAKGADPTFDAVYKGLVKIRNTGMAEPDAIVMHPNDWQDIRLTRTADGIYILGNPADRGAETLFGLPIYQTSHQTENTALAGAFRAHSQLLVRQGVQLAATNSNEDYFLKGKVAIRAAMRAALVVYRASAYCEITGI